VEERSMNPAKVGDHVAVRYDDIAGYVNESLSNVKVAKATNEGVLIKKNKSVLILQAGFYDKEPFGDYTIIPTGCVTSIKVIRRK
jgi:hypothetical protein